MAAREEPSPQSLNLIPQGLALSLQQVTLTASGNSSMRCMPWEVVMSQRCACQPWRFALPRLPRPFPPPPRSPGLTIKGARASLGPTLHPIFRTWSHSFHSRFQGHTAFYSAFPCSAHSPTATILKTFIYFSLKAAIFYHQFFLSLPAGSAAHTSTLRHFCLH